MEELKNKLKEGTFYFYKFGLYFKSKVMAVYDEKTFLSVQLQGGWLDVFPDNIAKVKRPGDILNNFEWCYAIKNCYGDINGYIGVESVKEENKNK